MNKLRIPVLALCSLMLAVPAAEAKKDKRQWRISTNYERVATDESYCRTVTNGDQYHVKETIESVRKYSETGVFPNGGQRRVGYEQLTTTTESDDPYIQSGTFAAPKRDISDFYKPDQWEVETDKKGRLVYEYEDAFGNTAHETIRSPKKGKSITRDVSTQKETERASSDRCEYTSEFKITETVTIKRIK